MAHGIDGRNAAHVSWGGVELVGEVAEFTGMVGAGLRLVEGGAGTAEPCPSEVCAPQDVINVPIKMKGTPYFHTPVRFIVLP